MHLKKTWVLAPALALAACGNGRDFTDNAAKQSPTHEAQAATTASDTTEVSAPVAQISPLSAPTTTPAAVPQKLIRTASFKCSAQNAFTAVTQLERLAQSVGGLVQESNIETSKSEVKTIAYKQDSLKEISTNITTAQLTLRVPSQLFDSVVRAIPALVSYIDSRTITQNNAALRYMANDLKNDAAGSTNASKQALQLAKKSTDAIAVEQYALQQQEENISRKIENLQLADQVAYAILTVCITQPSQVYTQVIADAGNIAKVPYDMELRSALANGIDIVAAIIIAFMSIWPLLLMIVSAWFIYRKIRYGTFSFHRQRLQ